MTILTLACLAFTLTATAFAIYAASMVGEAKRIAQEALNAAQEANDAVRLAAVRIEELKNMIPEDIREEKMRRDVLMRELNDEMERRVEAEKLWNQMVDSVLNYNVNTARAAGGKDGG